MSIHRCVKYPQRSSCLKLDSHGRSARSLPRMCLSISRGSLCSFLDFLAMPTARILLDTSLLALRANSRWQSTANPLKTARLLHFYGASDWMQSSRQQRSAIKHYDAKQGVTSMSLFWSQQGNLRDENSGHEKGMFERSV